MKKTYKNTLISFILVFNLIILPPYSLGADPYLLEPSVSSFFSPELQVGQNYSWKVQEWNQMDDWLSDGTNYVPKSGDIWNMTIIGDLSQITPKITALEFLGIHYDSQSVPKLSDNATLNLVGKDDELETGSTSPTPLGVITLIII